MKQNNETSRVAKLNRDTYDQLYGSYSPLLFLFHGRVSFDQQSKTRLVYDALIPIIHRLIAERGKIRVLHYGCGWGTFLLKLPRKKVEAYGYDISERAVHLLQRASHITRRHIRSVTLNDQSHILPDNFDVIVCSHVLEHVPSDRKLLLALIRALSPGGFLMINVPINEVWDDPKHVRRYDSRILEGRMRAAGLRIISNSIADRWTSFLLKRQMLHSISSLEIVGLRILRTMLAILPRRIVYWSEVIFLGTHQPQQLLVLATK